MGSTSRSEMVAGADEQVGGAERLGQPGPLALGQRRDQARGERLGPVVQLVPCALARPCQRGHPAAPVGRVGVDVDEPVVAQAAEHPGEVAGVEVEAVAQVADGGAGETDLEEQAGDVERPARSQERLVERSDALGVGPVEAAEHGGLVHCLTLVRQAPLDHPCGAGTSGPVSRWDSCTEGCATKG